MTAPASVVERVRAAAAVRRRTWGRFWPETTIAAMFTERVAAHAEHRAVVDAHRQLTYAALDDLAARAAGALHARGIGPGDAVCSQLPNVVESTVLLLATARLGAIHVPIVPIYGPREVRFIVEQTAAPLLVTVESFRGIDHAALAQQLERDCASLRHVLVTDGVMLDSPLFEGMPVATAACTADDPAVVLYTSGTTGVAKGVVHSANTLLAECAAVQAFHRLTNDEVFVMPSPVAHMSGLLYGILVPAYVGGCAVLMPTWDPSEFLRLVQEHHGTFCGGATPFLQAIADHPRLADYDISSLRLFPCGGADVPPDLIRRAIDRLGIRSGRGYGSTEFPSITSSAGLDEPIDRRAETDGRPIGPNRILLRDLDGQPVAPGTEGEIWAQGPELFLGYWDGTLDADAFDGDGWFRTGDLGVVDADGYLTITGRLKDLIIRGGEKLSSREIEELVLGHPRVAAVAVIGMPDPELGERPCAFIVQAPGATPPTVEELDSYLTERGLSRRKHPERVEAVEVLPMTASGKVEKHVLKDLLWRRMHESRG